MRAHREEGQEDLEKESERAQRGLSGDRGRHAKGWPLQTHDGEGPAETLEVSIMERYAKILEFAVIYAYI